MSHRCPECFSPTDTGFNCPNGCERVSRTPETTGSAFIPFGVEWERMMLRKNKRDIVKMLKSALMQNDNHHPERG